MSWLVLSVYLLDVKTLTDIVDVLQLQGGVEALVVFAVPVGISREVAVAPSVHCRGEERG